MGSNTICNEIMIIFTLGLKMSQFVVFNTETQNFNFLGCDDGKLEIRDGQAVVKPTKNIEYISVDSTGVKTVIPENVPYTIAYNVKGPFKITGFIQFSIYNMVRDNNIPWKVTLQVGKETVFAYNIDNKVSPHIILPITYYTSLEDTVDIKIKCNVETVWTGFESAIIIESN